MVLERAWFLAASSLEVRDAPLAVSVMGQPVVLFRDVQQHIQALEDRCPHRNVALSLGRVVNGTLECRYHGWRFAGSGACVEVPCVSDGACPKVRSAQTVKVVERQGSVWVCLGEPLTAEPPLWPHVEDEGCLLYTSDAADE